MKKYFLFISAIFIVSIAFSQMTMSSWRAFEDNPNLLKTENSKFQDYISKTYRDSIPEEQRSEYKAYLRYMYFWQRRLGQYDDEILSYQPYYEAALDFSQNPICTSTDLANWELLGPHSTTSQNLGLITEVLYDAENPNVPLISSNHGGLWKFNTFTDKWYNVTDNMRLPGISATEIVRHPFYHDIIFASTGNGIFNTKYGIGIIKSIDNGDNWTVMNGFPHADAPRVPKIIIDPNDDNPNDSINMYAITNDKVYYTNDSGESWDTLPQQPNLNEHTHLLDIEIDGQGDILLSTKSLYGYNAQCFKYSDTIWSEILSNVDTITIKRCQFSSPVIGNPLLNDLVFAMIDMVKDTVFDSNGNIETINAQRNIYRSSNNGTTWSLYKEGILGVSAKCEIVFSPTTQFIYMGEIYRGGINYATGQDLNMSGGDSFHMDVRDIEIMGNDGDSEYSLWANDGGVSMIRVKLDGSSTQSSTNLNGSSLPVSNLIGLGVGTNNFIVTGAMHCNTFKKTENGEFINFDGGDGGDCIVNPFDNSSYYYQANSAFKSSKYGTIHSGISDWFIGGP